MLKQFSKHYFTIDQSNLIKKVYESCIYPCQATKILPKETLLYSTTTIPESVGQFFSADVLEDYKQRILVIRENLTSYTDACIIQNQTKAALKSAIIALVTRLKLGDSCKIRVDNQSSLSSLKSDCTLIPLGISLETGHPKNVNKNAGAEKAIRELREQIVKLSPHGGPIDASTLARAIAHLNDVIRHSGFSSKELLYSREKNTGENIRLDDKELSSKQLKNRLSSHHSSALYASRNGPAVNIPDLAVGDLVFVKSDRSKSKARDSYFIIELDDLQKLATVQKFPMNHFRHHPIKVHYQNLYLANDTDCESIVNNPNEQPCMDTRSLQPTPKKIPPYQYPKPTYYPSSSDTESENEEEPNTDPLQDLFLTPPTEDNQSDYDEPDNNSSVEDPDDFPPSGSQSPPEIVEHIDVPENSVIHLQQPEYGTTDYIRPNDVIFIVKDGYWQRARLLSHAGKKTLKHGSLYWNLEGLDDNWKLGCYLFPGQSWGILQEKDVGINLENVTLQAPSLSTHYEEEVFQEEVA